MSLRFLVLGAVLALSIPSSATAHRSVAREWNEALLEGIRNDFARPTVHARNLFHVSVAMYDAWAAFDPVADPFLLGQTVSGFTCPFDGIATPDDVKAAREEAISYAAYRLMKHRFEHSPHAATTEASLDSLLASLGYDQNFTSTDYSTGSPAALGNYIGAYLIAFGLQDGSNEENVYANRYYEPVNPPLIPTLPGNPGIVDPNRWQPLALDKFVDQSGNIIPGATPPFLSPEWGDVVPFSLRVGEYNVYPRDGFDYKAYHDPGPPPYLDATSGIGIEDDYKWTFTLVSTWSSHLEATDGVMWDVSPASIGNNPPLPTTLAAYRDFYDILEGGDSSRGRTVNPYTGQPYVPQIVPRGDYTRCLAEFWADGPNSETPPGHWFTILNYVHDHPAFERRFKGVGPVVDPLEWDVKAYFALGGCMHDVAVAAWGIKGCYDYIRPISALRAMADKGQSSDSALPSYDPAGIPLIPNYVELVQAGDPLEGTSGENVGKIKIKAWKGPEFINDPEWDVAGVDWILAENWWPYQRPTFITPPFAGYISGHSTYSRAAAELLTLMTGDEYFPGGMGEFECPQQEFLVFEDGPSMDITLQWATYRDASDQCSLSRIWGGIHPPADDIPGRHIGIVLGPEAFYAAESYFIGFASTPNIAGARVYPNPVQNGAQLTIELVRPSQNLTMNLYDIRGRLVSSDAIGLSPNQQFASWSVHPASSGIYFLKIRGDGWTSSHKVAVAR